MLRVEFLEGRAGVNLQGGGHERNLVPEKSCADAFDEAPLYALDLFDGKQWASPLAPMATPETHWSLRSKDSAYLLWTQHPAVPGILKLIFFPLWSFFVRVQHCVPGPRSLFFFGGRVQMKVQMKHCAPSNVVWTKPVWRSQARHLREVRRHWSGWRMWPGFDSRPPDGQQHEPHTLYGDRLVKYQHFDRPLRKQTPWRGGGHFPVAKKKRAKRRGKHDPSASRCPPLGWSLPA